MVLLKLRSQRASSQNSADVQPQFRKFPALPIELRQKVYQDTWESRTIVASQPNLIDYWPPGPTFRGKAPVTLHLCREARQETLRCYHEYRIQFVAVLGNRLFDRGYINPALDILHLELPFGTNKGVFTVNTVHQPVIRLTIDAEMEYWQLGPLLDWLATKSRLLPKIKTVDVWTKVRHSAWGHIMLYRHRIFRLSSSTPLTPLVCRQNVAYTPGVAEDSVIQCPNSDCEMPNWRWGFNAEESHPITSTSLEYDIQPGQDSKLPLPGADSKIAIPGISFDWTGTGARALLEGSNVLLFDPGEGFPRHQWAVCKVVDPQEVLSRPVISLGVRYLRYLDQRKAQGSRPQSSSEASLAEISDIVYQNTVQPGIVAHSETARLDGSRGVDDVAHGVCGPGWLYEPGQRFALPVQDKRTVESRELYPEVSVKRCKKLVSRALGRNFKSRREEVSPWLEGCVLTMRNFQTSSCGLLNEVHECGTGRTQRQKFSLRPHVILCSDLATGNKVTHVTLEQAYNL
ncbi:hypothetical protein QBC40DRAFT_186112 [Triangularia verruculosa]|uniref:2EXR domain-containing protein n=1 Tax=Triangularia verruculosa TaxID=2587418 RepID=A0AAN7ARS7_9PEZI|nr:hypothetical protein QBC40DRAFT_186112 [Triangularia verruculosa]